MAESSDNFVLELPEDVYKVLFAEDLVDYIMLENSPNYISESDRIPFREEFYNKFDPFTQRAVKFLESILKITHDYAFRIMQNKNLVSSYYYSIFAENQAVRTFRDCFDAKHFLLYCVNLSRLAADFYNHGILDAPPIAKEFIFYVLKEYDMTDGGWEAVRRIAERYGKIPRDSVYKLASQVIISDEMKSVSLAQDEVCRDESKSYLVNEEQNVLLENEETNIEEQEERVYSNENNLLRKAARFSSETISTANMSTPKDT